MLHSFRFVCVLVFVLALGILGQNEAGAAGQAPLKVALFLEDSQDSGYADVLTSGLLQAQKTFADTAIQGDIILSPDPAKQEDDFFRVAKAGYDLVIVPTVAFHTLLINNAGNFPKTHFAAINTQIKAPNVLSYTFADAEAAFLAGAAAALLTQHLEQGTNPAEGQKVGWVGGPDIPQLQGYLTGYRQGVKHVAPQMRVISVFAGSFTDPPAAKQAAEALYKDGVRVIMHAAERSAKGVFQAADSTHNYAIGCIAKQNHLSPSILFSLQKHADKAVIAAIQAVRDGSFKGGSLVQLNLANGGLSLSEMQNLPPGLAPLLAPRLQQLSLDIQNKKIKVDSGTPRGLCDCL